MKSSFAARGITTGVALLAAVAMFFVVYGGVTASAAQTSGTATISIGTGKAGKALSTKGSKVSAIAPAKGKKLKGKVVQVQAPVKSLTVAAKSNATLKGGVKFQRGKRKVSVTGLTLAINSGKTQVKGKVGGKLISVFTATGKADIDVAGKTVKVGSAKLTLTKAAGNAVRKALKLNKRPTGEVGRFGFYGQIKDELPPCEVDPNAPGCNPVDPCIADPTGPNCPPIPVVDPYLAECGVAATSKVTGALPVAAPLPTLTGAKNTVSPTNVDWGFKESFRQYVIFGAGGSLKAVDGASVQPGVPVPAGFTFPVSGGQYAANDPIDTSDDQAVIPGTGTSLFCATTHKFRVAISNPTIVIDGENSRIVADVDANLTGVWIPSQKIDLATLDLSGATPFYNKSGSEVSWGEIPVTLTQAGGDAICGTGEQAACSYTAGTELDPIDVSVKTPYDTTDLAALATYVETNLPFPITDSTVGGCTLPTLPDPKTIDAGQASDPAGTPVWKGDAARAAAAPDLSAATAVTGGGFNWGFRSSLRGSVNGTGEFNPALGATASNTPYYGNGGETPVFPRPVSPGAGQMSGPGKFFTWPAATTGGFYDAAGAGNADDRLVLKTQGRVAFCQTQGAQAYGVVFSEPTIVIDGADSRITMDVATRYRLSWVRGTVDIASLDLTNPGLTVNESTAGSTKTVTWTFPDAAGSPATGPVELTTAGENVVNMLSKGAYVAGLGLDGAKISASFPVAE